MPNLQTTLVEHAGSGYKMPEPMARRIDELSVGLPADFGYRRMVKTPTAPKFEQLEDGSRTDISFITTDDIDRDSEIVLPGGLDLTDFQKSPTVFYAHSYDKPIGRAMWIKAAAMGATRGITAKTRYAQKPKDWQGPWLPDAVYSMAQEGIGGSKSIGFIPLSARAPTMDEVSKRPEWKNASRIIDKAVLLEYSAAPLAANPNALLVAVSKGIVSKDDCALFGVDAKTMSDGYDQTGIVTDSVPSPTLYSHSSTQFDLPDHAAAAVKAMSDRVTDDDLEADGRETEPHLTLHYGLHTSDANDIRKAVEGVGPVSVKLGKVNHFPADANRKSDVLHIEATGAGLHALKKRLTALPHSNEYPDYTPHITLAYVKPGTAQKYHGMDGVDGMGITCRTLCFSDQMGNKTMIPLGEGKSMDEVETKDADGGGVLNENTRPAEKDAKIPDCPRCCNHEKVVATGPAGDDGLIPYECGICLTTYRGDATRIVDVKEPETKSGVSLNAECSASARKMIDNGDINHGEWVAPIASGRKPADCLGTGNSYPIIKDGSVFSRAVADAESRGANHAPAIASEARKLSAMIQSRGKAFVRPETIRKAMLRMHAAMKAEILATAKEEIREQIDRARGRV